MTNPHFIIAGERRSGSTSLFDILKQHPQISMPEQPDLDLFIEQELFANKPVEDSAIQNWNSEDMKAGYKRLFSGLDGVTGHKDADLLWWKPAHERLAKNLPETKFIIMLRDPIRRAESQYFNELAKGREDRTFPKALAQEDSGRATKWEQLHLHYKSRGCYAESLSHFYNFIPKEKVMVVILEDMKVDFDGVLKKICTFLGVTDPTQLDIQETHSNIEEVWIRRPFASSGLLKPFIDLYERIAEAIIRRTSKEQKKRKRMRRFLTGFYKRSMRKDLILDPAIREELEAFYAPHNRNLANLLERNIPW